MALVHGQQSDAPQRREVRRLSVHEVAAELHALGKLSERSPEQECRFLELEALYADLRRGMD